MHTSSVFAPAAAERAGYSGLPAAVARGDAAEVRALIARRVKPDERDAYGRTPLHVAAYGGHGDEMRVLVQAGAAPNALINIVALLIVPLMV